MLKQAKWAHYNNVSQRLESFEGVLPIQMQHSQGTALPLLVDDVGSEKFGADIIRFGPGEGVQSHRHVGAHILMVTKGKGILSYDGEQYPMFEGMVYLVPSNIPHAIMAESELVLVAIGNDHQPADSSSRLEIV